VLHYRKPLRATAQDCGPTRHCFVSIFKRPLSRSYFGYLEYPEYLYRRGKAREIWRKNKLARFELTPRARRRRLPLRESSLPPVLALRCWVRRTCSGTTAGLPHTPRVEQRTANICSQQPQRMATHRPPNNISESNCKGHARRHERASPQRTQQSFSDTLWRGLSHTPLSVTCLMLRHTCQVGIAPQSRVLPGTLHSIAYCKREMSTRVTL
jgi:hypothetical protein